MNIVVGWGAVWTVSIWGPRPLSEEGQQIPPPRYGQNKYDRVLHFPTPGCLARVGGGRRRVRRIKPSSPTPLSGSGRAAAETGSGRGATEDPFSAHVCRLRVGTLDAVQAEPGGPHAVNRRSACLRSRGPPATHPGAAPHTSPVQRLRTLERSPGQFRLF